MRVSGEISSGGPGADGPRRQGPRWQSAGQGRDGSGRLLDRRDDAFDDLIRHLALVHPSRYIRLIDGLSAVGLRGVHTLTDQSEALRFVAFIDRVYDAQIPMRATGTPLDQVFSEEMLGGGYRKKYLRAISRLNAQTHS